MKSDLKDFLQTFAAQGKVSLPPQEVAHHSCILGEPVCHCCHVTMALSCDRS